VTLLESSLKDEAALKPPPVEEFDPKSLPLSYSVYAKLAEPRLAFLSSS